MMGKQAPQEAKLFYYDICLERRIPQNHLLRKIKDILDFDFVYPIVKGCYGKNGNVSVPPPVIMKMMLLLFLYDVRSERELMDTIPFRMDWLWFLGYDLDEEIPNHSVLSKARARWGTDVFGRFFTQTVTPPTTPSLRVPKNSLPNSEIRLMGSYPSWMNLSMKLPK